MKVLDQFLKWGHRRSGYAMALLIAFCIPLLFAGCSQNWLQIRETPSGLPVHFTYEAPHAKDVAIVADFTKWKPQPMSRQGGTWSLEVSLAPGRYLYAFLVNGKVWQPDPGALLIDDDGFGKINSVLIVE